ncbi:MAG TPA: ferritin-like domain-containing protein [Chitinophagaceae bacterium]|nr:ferritin-like domain-containing protein [Chitinophagaceae bacterium]
MNLQNIISEIEKVDPEVYGKMDTRRSAMKKFANVSGKIAVASIPFALGSMFNTAYGQTTSTVNDVLNFALTLEYLEAEFYNNIVASPVYATIPAPAQAALAKIKDDENKHVAFLKSVLGTAAIAKPTFDFTAGSGSGTGPFAGYLASYAVQLAMAQTFEDTGVRAYKGQAPALQGNRTVLTAALEIHSVEARHASHIRQMRRALNVAIPSGQVVKPWITLNQTGIDYAPGNSAIQLSYNGEEVVSQAGATITGIGGNSFIDANAASEAFDEPLTTAQVLAIVTPFFG